MATTTNYAWETPDDTDLVKDGAAAIRTLGSSIDTTTKALNPSTTLGDIEYRSATANTNTRLGIGSTGNILTVSGGVPVWAAPAGGGGQTLISTTIMNTTNITLGSFSGYNDLKIVLRNPYVSSGYSEWKVNSDSSSIYRPSQQRADNGTTMSSLASAVTTALNLSPSSGPTSSTAYSTVIIYIHDYNNTSSYKLAQVNTYWGNWGGNYSASIEWHTIQTTSAVTSVNINGAWSGGSCLLYGVK